MPNSETRKEDVLHEDEREKDKDKESKSSKSKSAAKSEYLGISA